MSQDPGQYDAPAPAANEGGWGQPDDTGAPAGYGPPTGYTQAGFGVPQVGTGLIGRRRNPFVAWLLLPIVTLSIYHYVWIYKTNKELSRFDSRIEVNPTLSVLALFPGCFLIVPPFVAIWRLGTRIQQAQRAAGVQESSSVLSFVLWLFGFGILYDQFEINKIWDRYPGATEDTQVPLSA